MTGSPAYSACLALGVFAASLGAACDKGTAPPKKSAPPANAAALASALPATAPTTPATAIPSTTGGAEVAASAATAAPAAGAPEVPSTTGAIIGEVRFTGTPPVMPVLDRSRDSKCPQDPVTAAWLVIGKDGGVANAVVWLDLPMGGEFAVPKAQAVIDQKGCVYSPPVTAIMAGQTVRVKNSDDTFHNVHSTVGAETKFNDAHIQGTPDKLYVPAIGGGQAMRLACDIHPWMEAWIFAAPTPYFAVTDATGRFRILGVPAGKVRVAVWHPFLDPVTAEVTVVAGKDTTAELAPLSSANTHGPKP